MKKTNLVIGLLLFLFPAMHAMETSVSAEQSPAVDYSDPRYETVQKIIEYIMYSGKSEDIRNFRLACKTLAQETAKLISAEDKKEISEFFGFIQRKCIELAISIFITEHTVTAENIHELATSDALHEAIKKEILVLFTDDQVILKNLKNNIQQKIIIGKLIGYFKGEEDELLFALLVEAASNGRLEVADNLLSYVVSTLPSDGKQELLECLDESRKKKLASLRSNQFLSRGLSTLVDRMHWTSISNNYDHIRELIEKLPIKEEEKKLLANNNK